MKVHTGLVSVIALVICVWLVYFVIEVSTRLHIWPWS